MTVLYTVNRLVSPGGEPQEEIFPRRWAFFSSLDKSLQDLDAQKQMYQGGTFTGNHVHKLLQVYIVSFLVASPPMSLP